ncbi:MAG: ribose-phosphate pyrophosphokinase [Smithellaceae bacterium]
MSIDLKIFSGSANPQLAQSICHALGLGLSQLEISRFSNDNLFVQILENVREKDVFIVQPFTAPVSDTIMELFIVLDALRSASARRITAVIPYFSYARSDKKDAPRISITGRLVADLIKAAGANRVLTMDLHSDAVHGFFSIPVDHLTAVPYFVDYFHERLDLANAVVVATDAGGAKRAGRFAGQIHLPMAIIDKRRVADTEVVQGLVVGEVRGRDAIIFEDEIATGGTLVASVKTLAGRCHRDEARQRPGGCFGKTRYSLRHRGRRPLAPQNHRSHGRRRSRGLGPVINTHQTQRDRQTLCVCTRRDPCILPP